MLSNYHSDIPHIHQVSQIFTFGYFFSFQTVIKEVIASSVVKLSRACMAEQDFRQNETLAELIVRLKNAPGNSVGICRPRAQGLLKEYGRYWFWCMIRHLQLSILEHALTRH